MQFVATSKYVKIAPSKAVAFARLLKGLPVAKALNAAQLSNKKAASFIGKTLKSAVANAENNAELSAEDFRVKHVLVEKGPALRRYWHRSRGMARPIMRRTSNIRVVIADDN